MTSPSTPQAGNVGCVSSSKSCQLCNKSKDCANRVISCSELAACCLTHCPQLLQQQPHMSKQRCGTLSTTASHTVHNCSSSPTGPTTAQDTTICNLKAQESMADHRRHYGNALHLKLHAPAQDSRFHNAQASTTQCTSSSQAAPVA
jgi:hypothetical protein